MKRVPCGDRGLDLSAVVLTASSRGKCRVQVSLTEFRTLLGSFQLGVSEQQKYTEVTQTLTQIKSTETP